MTEEDTKVLRRIVLGACWVSGWVMLGVAMGGEWPLILGGLALLSAVVVEVLDGLTRK